MKEEPRKLLEKAERSLSAAEVLAGAGDAELAAGRAYYAMLHTAQALLRQNDLRYRKHASVHGAYGKHFAKSGTLDPKFHRWMLVAFNQRIKGDYDTDSGIDMATASRTIEQAREFLAAAPQHLSGTP